MSEFRIYLKRQEWVPSSVNSVPAPKFQQLEETFLSQSLIAFILVTLIIDNYTLFVYFPELKLDIIIFISCLKSF